MIIPKTSKSYKSVSNGTGIVHPDSEFQVFFEIVESLLLLLSHGFLNHVVIDNRKSPRLNASVKTNA